MLVKIGNHWANRMKYAIYYEGKTPETRAAYGTVSGTFELEQAIRQLDLNNELYPKFQHSLVEMQPKGSGLPPRRIQPAELAELRRPYDQTQERREAELAGKVGK